MATLSSINVTCLKYSSHSPLEVAQFLHRYLPLQFARLHPLSPQGWVEILIQDSAKWWVWEKEEMICAVVSIGWMGPQQNTARFSYFTYDQDFNLDFLNGIGMLCEAVGREKKLSQLLFKTYDPNHLTLGQQKGWPVFHSYLHFAGRIGRQTTPKRLENTFRFLWNITEAEAGYYAPHCNTAAQAMPVSELTSWDYTILPEHITSKTGVGIQRAMLELVNESGEMIGFTAIEHAKESPHKIYQMFTYVAPEHRKKGLAKALKKTMAAKMAERYPEAWVTAETFVVNEPTIRLNESLGLLVTAKGKEFLIPIEMLVA